MSSSSSKNNFTRSFDEVSGIYLAALRGASRPVQLPKEDLNEEAVIYRDETTAKLFALAESVARRPTTVLLSGESGVGKEVFARFIHRESRRAEGPMVGINCAGLTSSLLESELFGHEKGAFSGAIRRHLGVFEQAQGGTLLLDEISEMALETQAKLLRVLQEREVVRVGGNEAIKIDIRIIATTNRDLPQYVKDGHFRRDLFFRLNVFPLEIPPLRKRPKDIVPLINYFLARIARIFESPVQGISNKALRKLEAYSFPGNIRELVNIIKRALILADEGEYVGEEHISLDETMGDGDVDEMPERDAEHVVRFRAGDDSLTDIRRVLIQETLRRNDGNRAQTAEQLGVSTRTIRNKLKDYEDNDK